MRALLLQRGVTINRRISRLWQAAGLDLIVTEDPDQAREHALDVGFIGADEFDRNVVEQALEANPSLRAVIWTAEPLTRTLRFARSNPRLTSILGRASFDTTPSPWELLYVARRTVKPHEALVPLEQLLQYGAGGFSMDVSSRADLDACVARCAEHTNALQVPSWIVDHVQEVAHELLMNAVYDAPVDDDGAPRFAQDRKAEITLSPEASPRLTFCSDGLHLALRVVDPFGRLTREHVFDGLERGLKEGALDTTGGGAGLGIAVCHNASLSLMYDVVPKTRTCVTAMTELEVTRRDFRSRARSVHFFERPI